MKPKNFPGRKNLRRAKAGRLPYPNFEAEYIKDINLRVGAKNRNVYGTPKTLT